jgi:hypothetical protein
MEFIKENTEFWSKIPSKNDGGKLLIEETDHPMATHVLSIFSIILNQAEGYTPVWMCGKRTRKELIKSYRANANFISPQKLSALEKIKIISLSLKEFFLLLKNKNILSFTYDGIYYGDFLYDAYLLKKQIATIKKINFDFFYILLEHLNRHEIVKKTIQNGSYSAVLVSHPIGLRSGVLLRVAKKMGLKVYQSSGDNRACLILCDKSEKDKAYPYKLTNQLIDELISIPDKKFNDLYDVIYEIHTSGKLTPGARYAFSKKFKYYFERGSFNQDFGLNPKLKNIFVMLHAFTDYPHSHFDWMLFNDYFDWFIQTLEFAKMNPHVNWIFKQHPANKLYPTKDVSYEKIFSVCPKNVIYIDEENNIDTRSLVHVADLIITCLGSAGYELPAMGGIPSMTAGENPYYNVGFVIEPKTQAEYFSILKNANSIERLGKEKIKRARAAYLFMNYLSKVDFSAVPIIVNEDLHRKDIDTWFWHKVSEQYANEKEKIYCEIIDYINQVKKPGFSRLSTAIDSIKIL